MTHDGNEGLLIKERHVVSVDPALGDLPGTSRQGARAKAPGPVLSLADAKAAIAAAIRHAERIGVPSTVTVLDAGGRLIAAGRMDGAPLISVDSSAAKARTAVFFKTATADLVAAVQPGAPLYTIADATPEPLAFLGGGIPILAADGQLLGAIGSGGGTPDQDAAIAQAGAGPTVGSAPLPGSRVAQDYEVVAEFVDLMPTGVTVSSSGRLFVSFPRWGDDVAYTVGEVVDGAARPYPDTAFNALDAYDAGQTLVSVQSVVIDPAGHLWLLDTGSLSFGPWLAGGPKLVEIDLELDQVVRVIPIVGATTPTTYLNDVRFDLSRGTAGYAYVTDSQPTGALIVVDLASGQSWAKLRGHHSTAAEPGFRAVVDGKVRENYAVGADGIAINPDGSRLYYCPLSSRRLYSVSTDLLIDPATTDDAVAASIIDHGDKGASDGLESDADGAVYVTSYEHSAVLRLGPDGTWTTVMHGPDLVWPDTLALADDGYLYASVNQLPGTPLFNGGVDGRVPPYRIVRKAVAGRPIHLSR